MAVESFRGPGDVPGELRPLLCAAGDRDQRGVGRARRHRAHGEFDRARACRVRRRSLVTAPGRGVAFTLVGKRLLRLIGIAWAGFQIGGGAIVLGLALPDNLGRPLVRDGVQNVAAMP